MLQVVQRVITRHLPDRAGLTADEGDGRAVTLIQRFGSAANLNIHLHCPVLDGVYRCGADGVPSFVEVDAPTDDKLHALLQSIDHPADEAAHAPACWWRRWAQTPLAEPSADGDEARMLRPLQAAAITYRISFGPAPGGRC